MEDGRKQSQAAAGSLTAIWKPGFRRGIDVEIALQISLSCIDDVKLQMVVKILLVLTLRNC